MEHSSGSHEPPEMPEVHEHPTLFDDEVTPAEAASRVVDEFPGLTSPRAIEIARLIENGIQKSREGGWKEEKVVVEGANNTNDYYGVAEYIAVVAGRALSSKAITNEEYDWFIRKYIPSPNDSNEPKAKWYQGIAGKDAAAGQSVDGL